jgi:hypothetical protein
VFLLVLIAGLDVAADSMMLKLPSSFFGGGRCEWPAGRF